MNNCNMFFVRSLAGSMFLLIPLQQELCHTTFLWLLANPSGLNAHFQLDDHIRLFEQLAAFVQTCRASAAHTPAP